MPDRYHVEAWSLPLATSTRTVARVPFVAGSFDAEVSAAGRGSLKVRKDWPRLTDVVDAANGVASLLRVFQDNVLIEEGSFFARRAARTLTDDAEGLVTLSGPGIGDVMNFGRVENFDYPVVPTVDPDWSWGAGDAINGFKNGSFEESVHINPTLTGGKYDTGTGFEDENSAGWKTRAQDPLWRSVLNPPVVASTPTAPTGTFSLVWTAGTPAAEHAYSGIEKKLRIAGGERYQFTLVLEDPSTSGDRYLFGVENVATVHHTNGFVENGIAWAELDNAVEGAGATDGTAQTFDLDVTFVAFTNYGGPRLYVARADTGAATEVLVDDYTGAGYNLGLFPWEPTSFGTVTTFEQDLTPPTPALEGDATANIVTNAANHGIGQPIEGLTPGRTYTFLAGGVHHDVGSNQDFTVRLVRTSGGTVLSSTTTAVTTGGTWTEITATAEVDVEDIFVQVLKVTSGEWWLDDMGVIFGQAAASWGDIWDQLIDDAAVDHTAEAVPFERDTLGFLTLTSTIALDSAGNAWAPAVVNFGAKRGPKYARLLSDGGARIGFEWQVRDTLTGPELDLFNPHDWATRTGGMGTNLAGTGVPEIVYGAGVTGGPLIEEPSTANRVHIEGEAGLFAVRRDTASIADFDTRELYEGHTDLLAAATIGTAADQALEERTIPNTALKVKLSPHESDTVPIPFRDFNLGDTYPINLVGDFTGDKRVVKIACDFTPGYGAYTVDFDQATYTSDPLKGTIEAVRRLIEQFESLDKPADLSGAAATVAVDAAGYPAFLVAASNAPDETKAVAHFLCDGVADEVEIQAAITALIAYIFGDDEDPSAAAHGGRGTVTLSTGLFQFSDPGTVAVAPGVSLIGSGRSTVLLADDDSSSVPVFILSDRASIGNFYVDRAGDTPG